MKEFVFIWLIENYSYLWHTNGEKITSPMFIVDTFENIGWELHLYPRGSRAEDKDYISLYLHRTQDYKGPEIFSLNYELAFLASDGSTLYSYECKDFNFVPSGTLGRHQFMMTNDILIKEKIMYLPQGILTVRCRMWKSQNGEHKSIRCRARTLVGIETITSLETVDDFSTLNINQPVEFLIKSSSDERFFITARMYLNDNEEKIMLELSPCNIQQKKRFSSRVFLKDASGRMIKCGQDDDVCRTIEEKWILPLQFTKNIIMENKSEYLSNDRLYLLCEFTFSNGQEIKRIEITEYGILKLPLTPILFNLESPDSFYIKKKLFDSPSSMDDLKTLYRNQTFSDVKLKTKTKVFSAHKAVLCARSPVFKAMFTNDMKEKNVNYINLDDIDDDILDKFLLFLYTDILENLQWGTVINLYYVADKYQVERLKLKCSSFFIDNIKISNVNDILLLSDLHQDSDLKAFVTNFILRHHEDIFSSKKWHVFAEKNSQLALEVMLLIHTKKQNMIK